MSAFTRFLFDPVDASRDRAASRFQFSGDTRWWLVPLGLGAALLALGAVLGVGSDLQRFLFAYLVGWIFCVSIAIGAMFFVMIQHIVKARWSTSIRRIPEMLMTNFPLLALFGIPVLLGNYDLYHWTHGELYSGPDADYILQGKAGYFFFPLEAGTVPIFWFLRYPLYFGVWIFLSRKLYTYSVANDTEPSVENTKKLRFHSAWGIPVGAVLVSFFAYDMLMSLEPHWFSTMWGVYFFAGGWLASLCLITMLALTFKKGGMLREEVTTEHLQDMGKFMFAFVVFWTYIAFSQYMLYWYGNLPEETVWFHKRALDGYGMVGQSLVWFHFVLPFLILLPRITKRVGPALAVMAGWLLVMHFIDLWWMVIPAIIPAGDYGGAEAYAAMSALFEEGQTVLAALPEASASVAAAGAEGTEAAMDQEALFGYLRDHMVPAYFHPADILCWLGFFGLFLGATLLRASRHALTPYNDPYFGDSVRFENV
ncbi:MAG: hypothetical protein AAF791_13695 [Bacteroidota bacterium]